MAGSIPTLSETNPLRLVRAIRELFEGRSNAVGSVTLTENTTTTTVTAPNIGPSSEIFLSPRTSNAAVATANVRITSVGSGTFTITHSNTATTDRTFGWVAFG